MWPPHVAQGLIDCLRGRHAEAHRALWHALEIATLTVEACPWPALTAEHHLARVALAVGDVGSAREGANRMRALLDRYGYDDSIFGPRLADLGRRLGATPDELGQPLSEREAQVLALLRGSLPLVDLAAELDVSVNTLKSHVRMIYRKLGVSSRAEAVGRARVMRLL